MELGNQQERRLADIHWFAGFFDGEGCVSIVQYKKRRFTQFAVSARLVGSTDHGLMQCVGVLMEWDVPHHVAWTKASKIGSREQWRLTIMGYKRVRKFLDVLQPYLRVKRADAAIASDFINSRLLAGSKAPYSDREIDLFLELRELHGYRLNESSETLRKTLIERRYSPTSDRKTESAAEMTAPA